MIHAACVIIAMGFGIAVAAAQSDPIAARQALMKSNGRQAKLGSDMIRGKVPFDVAKAKGVFSSFIEAGNKMPHLFPENSGNTSTT